MKYILKLLPWVATAGTAWTLGAWFNLFWFQDPAWITSIYRQKADRAEQIKAPRRLLLVGGSSTHFGVEAEQLQETLGVPTVNLGLHAGLGLDALLTLAEEQVRPGDIVVLFPEHDLLATQSDEKINILSTLVAFRTGNMRILKNSQEGPEQVANRLMLVGSPRLFDVVNAVKTAIVSRGKKPNWYKFNVTANGDAVDHLAGRPALDMVHVELSEESRQRISLLRDRVHQRQATLILGVPWKLARKTPQTQRELKGVIADLSQIAPVVYNPQSLNLKQDVSLFGDSTFHLTQEGRTLRTTELAKQLELLLPTVAMQTPARNETAAHYHL